MPTATATERPMRSIAPLVSSSGEIGVAASPLAEIRPGLPEAPCVSYSRSIFLSSAFQLMMSVTGGLHGRYDPAQVRRSSAAQGNVFPDGASSVERIVLPQRPEHAPN